MRFGVADGSRTRDGGITIRSLDHLATATPKRTQRAAMSVKGFQGGHDAANSIAEEKMVQGFHLLQVWPTEVFPNTVPGPLVSTPHSPN